MKQQDLHPESQNLAPDLDTDEAGEELCELIELDDDSRSEWLGKHADWIRMYYQEDKPRNPPWEGSSTESVPMLAEACNQFHARAYQAMFPGREVVRAIPAGKVDAASKERAERIGTHMSWQLTVRDKTYKRNKDRLLLSLPLHGSFFTKTYYNPVLKRNVVENVRAQDFIVPYGIGPRDLEDIDRKTQVIHYSLNACRKLEKSGFFSDVPEQYLFDRNSEPDDAHDESQGLSSNPLQTDIAKLYECHTVYDFDGDGIAEPYIFIIDATSHKVLRVAIRYDTDEAGQPTNDKAPVEYFTHYTYLENPDGFYGLGQGHLISQPNAAVNKLVRQTVDAGTLQNALAFSGFVTNAVGIPGGELEMGLGHFKKIAGDDLSRGIWQPKINPPSPVLMDIAALLMQRSDRLATVTEALTGQTESVMQPTTVMALIDQGLQVFSAVQGRVLDAMGSELQKIYRLNHKYMDPEEYFAVLDITGDLKNFSASRMDYEPDFQVIPVADPKQVGKQQELAKAQAEYQVLMRNPLVISNPLYLYNATVRYLKAIEADNIDEILPNPAKEILPREDDPRAENALLGISGLLPLAYPDQDHVAHLEAHQELLQDPDYGHHLSEIEFAKMLEHIKAHAMMMYGQTEAGDGGPGSLGAMVPQPGNAMGAEQPSEGVPPGLDERGLGVGLAEEGPGGGAGAPEGPGGLPGE